MTPARVSHIAPFTHIAAALALVGALIWWRLGPDWRAWIALIAGDVILRRSVGEVR